MDEVEARVGAGGTLEARALMAEYYAQQSQWEKATSIEASRPTPHLVELLRLVIDPGEMPLEAAVNVWRVRMLAREEEAFQHVIDLLYERGQTDHALDVLGAAAGTPPAWRRLDWPEWYLRLSLLLREDRVVEALAMGDDDMVHWLVPVLAERGHIEALRVLMRPGKTGFALHLARALATRGRLDEAVAIMMERIDADEQNAYEWTIELLVELGEADRALKVRRKRGHKLRSSVDTSDFQLARLLDQQGRHEEAIDVLSHKGGAPRQLADMLAGIGRMDDAMRVLDGAQRTARVKSVSDELAEHQAALLARYGHLRKLRQRAANGRPEHREIMRSHLARAQAA